MVQIQEKLVTNTWICATWPEYLDIIAQPVYEKAKSYYFKAHMRLEMSPVGHDHARDDSTIALAVNLLGLVRSIPLTVLSNCSYRKTGIRECQPSSSYYLRDRAQAIPTGTGIIDLDQYPPPNLVIEIANPSLLDDIGTKRALYEEMGIDEYWVVDVQNVEIFAYAIAPQGSQRIQSSGVLPGLEITFLKTVLQRSREIDQLQLGAWFLNQFQSSQ